MGVHFHSPATPVLAYDEFALWCIHES